MSERTMPALSDRKISCARIHFAEDRARYIETIASAPARLRAAVTGLSAAQLDTPYREGGWTVRQVIHHVPDSHMNAYIRFKLALTETDPVIKPYDEAAWARLNDIADTPVETSLALLDALHQRWVILMRGMSEEEWKRRYHASRVWPGAMPLEHTLALYAWHCDHHIAHVKSSAGGVSRQKSCCVLLFVFLLRVVIRVLAVELARARAIGHDAEHVVFAQSLHGANHVVIGSGSDAHDDQVPSVRVESRFASAENSSGGVSRMTQLKTLRSPSSVCLTWRILSSSSGFLTCEPAGRK